MRKGLLSVLLSLVLMITTVAGGFVAFENNAYAAQFKITSPLTNSLKPAGNITIKWNEAESGTVNKYEVYVDGAKVGETTTTSYDYYNTKVTSHTAYVKAVFANGTDAQTPSVTFYVSKKGLGLATDMGAKIDLRELGCSWYYNWGENPSDGSQYAGIDYVPMVWKETNANNFKNRVNNAINKGYKEILTFNEPDLGGQCDMPVNDVYNVWQGIDGFDGDIRISSPVTALWPKASSGWFQPFMSMLNASDYQPDFISIHCYPDSYAGASMANWFVEEIVDWTWNTYHLPIWITEFSTTGGGVTAEGNNGTKEFWQTVMPLLDERDYVERYAAFGFNADNSPNVGLWKYSDGSLTAGGNVYKTLGNPEGYDYNNLPEGDYTTTIGTRNTLLDNAVTIGGVTYTDLIGAGTSITASSNANNNGAGNAIDNNINSRWESVQKVDPQYVTLDLGSVKSIKQVDVVWEDASAAKYKIEVSDDGTNFTEVATVSSGTGARWDKTVLKEMATGRYVRIYGTARTTNYGYSIYDMAIYGTDAVVTTQQQTQAQTTQPATTQVQTTQPATTQVQTTAPSTTQVQTTQVQTTAPVTTQVQTTAPVTTQAPGNYNDETDADLIKERILSAANIAKGKTAAASSTTTPNGYQPREAVDGNLGSMWGAATSGKDEWIAIDLGENTKIDSVAISWEGAYASKYDIQVSNDGINYTTVRSVTATKAETIQLEMPLGTTGQYIRMYATEAGTGWNMKLYEIGVFGSAAGSVETTTQVQTTAPATTVPATTVPATTQVQTTVPATTQVLTTATPTTVPATTQVQTTAQTTTQGDVPQGPSGFATVDGTKLMWQAAKDASSYNVYVNGELVGNTTNLEYDLSKVLNQPRSYDIEVKAVGSSGTESSAARLNVTVYLPEQGSSTVVESDSAKVNVAQVKIKKAKKKKSAKKLVVTIKKVKGANGYQVAIFKTKKNAKKAKKAICKKLFKKNKTKLVVKNKKLKNKKKLFARVRAYVLDNGKKRYGKYSKVKKVKIK